MNRLLAISATAALTLTAASLALAQPSPVPTAQTAPATAPAVTPAPTPAPTTTPAPPSPAPASPTPTAVPTPSPSGAVYHFTATPSPAPNSDPNAPRILEVDVNEATLHAPGPIAFRILTSANVINVTAKVMGREVTVPQVGSGVFAASGELPGIPFFLYGNHRVDIVAAAADGKTAQTSVTLRLEH